MLDFDLAELYGVTTGALNQSVSRNLDRFPSDFMFRLSRDELRTLKSQFVILEGIGRRQLPRAFTEEGVAMLSSVLRSSQAVQVNVEIMRAFVRLRHASAEHRELSRRLDELERQYDGQFAVVFEALRELMEPPSKPGRRIGFARPAGAQEDEKALP